MDSIDNSLAMLILTTYPRDHIDQEYYTKSETNNLTSNFITSLDAQNTCYNNNKLSLMKNWNKGEIFSISKKSKNRQMEIITLIKIIVYFLNQ